MVYWIGIIERNKGENAIERKTKTKVTGALVSMLKNRNFDADSVIFHIKKLDGGKINAA